MKRAMVVQPNEAVTSLVAQALGEMFALETVSDYQIATELTSDSSYDVIICVVTESTFDQGIAFATHLRTFDHYAATPFIILSDVKNTHQLARAFEAGCDEYLSLPIEPIELRIRVRARRKELVPAPKTNFFWAADLRFDVGTLRVVATDDASSSEIELTPNEFRILFLLSRHLNKTLSRDFILAEVGVSTCM